MKTFNVVILCIIVVLTACQNHTIHISQRNIESTFTLAGENSSELERVLEHYQDDPQKLAAARYLIADMKDNYYLVSDGIDSVHAALVTTSLQEGFLERNRRDRWMAYRYEGTAEKIYDVQTVSAEYLIDKATDGKNLTRYESGTPGAACVFELELPSEVSCIVYAPRNDDNYVSPGDVYELFYQDGVNGWESLGVKTAEDWYLEYDNVPAGALLWLHNHTKGVEEQAFRWDNGSQIFCYKL